MVRTLGLSTKQLGGGAILSFLHVLNSSLIDMMTERSYGSLILS